MRRRLLLALPLAALLGLLLGPALARENRALIVGVSTYPGLEERFWLQGPANDARLILEFLTTAAPARFRRDNIILLADGVEGADDLPTLGAIRAAFARLIDSAAEGDFVYLHFSGHGSLAPERVPGSEPSGYDQIFLPMDVGSWNNTVGMVENALVDDEIGVLIAALTARGAHVFAVFDACHSDTLTRALPTGEERRSRQLAPEALGIPEAALEGRARALPPPGAGGAAAARPDPRARPAPPIDASEAPAERGSLVAFYAAQTTEVAEELRMPPGKLGRKPHGIFTFTLLGVLAEYPDATYAQVAQEVLRRYAVQNLTRTTPMFEGALEQAVFGSGRGGRVAQWPAEVAGDALRLPAGRLHGLAEGTLLAILPSAAAGLEAALGYAEVVAADSFSAAARPVAHAGLPAPGLAALPRGLYLRRTEAALDFGLSVALPAGTEGPAAAMRAAAALLEADGFLGPRIRFVEAGEAADIMLDVIPDSDMPDAIWMLPGAGSLDAGAAPFTPRVRTADRSIEALAEAVGGNLTRMATAINLMRIGASAIGAGGVAEGVQVELMTRAGPGGALEPVPPGSVPRLIPGDEVWARLTNRLRIPVDVNVLHIGSDYAITHFVAVRLQPGESIPQGLFGIGDSAYGRDRVVVVISPARPQTAVESLAFLAQGPVEAVRALGGPSPLQALLSEAGYGSTTRAAVPLGASPEPEGPAPAILQFDIDTAPAP